jgi:hypothetical protein
MRIEQPAYRFTLCLSGRKRRQSGLHIRQPDQVDKTGFLLSRNNVGLRSSARPFYWPGPSRIFITWGGSPGQKRLIIEFEKQSVGRAVSPHPLSDPKPDPDLTALAAFERSASHTGYKVHPRRAAPPSSRQLVRASAHLCVLGVPDRSLPTCFRPVQVHNSLRVRLRESLSPVFATPHPDRSRKDPDRDDSLRKARNRA